MRRLDIDINRLFSWLLLPSIVAFGVVYAGAWTIVMLHLVIRELGKV